MGKVRAYVGIGSNMGERCRNCREALERLETLPGCRLKGHSAWYLTSPIGVEDQDWFVNGVAVLETDLSPGGLLNGLLETERAMGRIRAGRWGPRIIDLDLLLFGEEIIDAGDLKVPHPRMEERLFVLVPMNEIEPGLRHPVHGVTIRELLARVPGHGQEVRKTTCEKETPAPGPDAETPRGEEG